ncbi:MAG: M43 family zinc metalloprotease [Bacteroidota bacterium]
MIKHWYSYVLVVLFISLTGSICAQQCKASSIRRARTFANPALLHKIQQIENHTQNWIRNNQDHIQLREVITLPVVVHVLWRTETENISIEQIESQMKVLNDDFRLMNQNFSFTPTAFKSLAADVEIEFCLASMDPNGNPTNGITRTQTDIINIGETEAWYSTAAGGKDPWNINEYINIWVCDIGGEETLGFASFPGTADPPQSDGLVIGHRYFGTTGTANFSRPNHLGRTATHEMGHYFNLEHIWGEEAGDCNIGDFVSDTPRQYEDSFGCPNYPLRDDCTPGGNGVMFVNYMDYTDDACMSVFTHGQKARMLATLGGPRSRLLSSNGCNLLTNTSQVQMKNTIMHLFPNPSQGMINLQLEQMNTSQKDLHYEVRNLHGQVIKSWEGGPSQTIITSDWIRGVYIFSCLEYPKISQKLVVQ